MKKELILIFLLIIPFVSAKGVNILGNEYSLVIVLPFIFMICMLFFFLIIFITDKLKKIKKIKFKLKFFKKKKKQKEEKPVIDFLAKLNSLGRKLKDMDNKSALDQIYGLTKEFYKTTFSIEKEFTLSEVYDLIKGHVNEIKFANRISELKYGDKILTRKDILFVYTELRLLINKHTPKVQKKNILKLPKFHFHFKLPTFKLKPHKKEIHKEEPKIKLEIPKPIKLEPKEEYLELKPKKIFFIKKWIENNKLRKQEKKQQIQIKKQNLAELGISKYKLRSEIRQLNKFISKVQKHIKKNNVEKAKLFFSKMILVYYKLPLEEEELFASRINLLSRKLRDMHSEKELSTVSEKLIKLKKNGKVYSLDSLQTINKLKDIIKKEVIKEPIKFTPKIIEEPIQEKIEMEFVKPKLQEIPLRRTPQTLKRLVQQENQIYNKLNDLKIKELERFKQKHPLSKPKKPYISKYHEFLRKIQPRDYTSKRLDALSEKESKIKQKLLEVN